MKTEQISEYRSLAIDIAKILDEKKASDIVMINVAHLSSLADWFVVATALNTTHAKSLTDELEEKLKLSNIKPFRREGVGEWCVLDYGEVIVHIFTQETRTFYHLEKLWNDGKNVFTLSGIDKVLEKEKKKAELEEKKNLKSQIKLKQKIEKEGAKEEKASKKLAIKTAKKENKKSDSKNFEDK